MAVRPYIVFATVYIFGIKQGIGSEVLSEFFHLLRLNRQIGVYPTALRPLEAQMRSKIRALSKPQLDDRDLSLNTLLALLKNFLSTKKLLNRSRFN